MATWNPVETATLHWVCKERLKEDSIIVDGGGHLGQLIDELRGSGIDGGKYYVIEAAPKLAQAIFEKKLTNVFVYNAALVGRKQDYVLFYDFGTEMRGNTKNLYPNYGTTYQVRCITLEELNLPVIDYLKLDVEGTEGEIVENMTQEMANKIKQISIEVHPNVNREGLKGKLIQLGFEVQDKTFGHDVYGGRE